MALRAQLDSGKLTRVSPTKGAETVAKSANVLAIQPGEIFAARTGKSPTLRGLTPAVRPIGTGSTLPAHSDSVFVLPFTYIGFDKSGRTPAYQPTLTPRGGLHYVSAQKLFAGSFTVGLELTDDPGEQRDLAKDVTMSFGGDADSISPSSVSFKSAGGAEATVNVYMRLPKDSLRVLIIPKFDPRNPAEIWLAVRPTLTIETPPATMQGFGVESRSLKIGTRGVQPKDSFEVAVSSSAGALSTDIVHAGRAGGSVTLRSSGGLGNAEVLASAPGFEDAEATIAFVFPYLFGGAAVLGGALGATWAQLRQRRRQSMASTARRVTGAIIGAILATAIYIGLAVNLLLVGVSAPLVNEIGVFAFAALGGMFGLKLLNKTGA
ncbi:MAG: hypothetical protein ABJB66_16030 [Gemmatimonadaceae bacterium]